MNSVCDLEQVRKRKLAQRPEFKPCALFESFGIEALVITNAATDELAEHTQLRSKGLLVLAPFRRDKVLHLAQEGWRHEIRVLERLNGGEISGAHSEGDVAVWTD